MLEAIFAVTPIETVKTKAIQTNAPFMQGVKNILKAEGPAGLYQGVWATIAKQGSNQVCVGWVGWVGGWEWSRDGLSRLKNVKEAFVNPGVWWESQYLWSFP